MSVDAILGICAHSRTSVSFEFKQYDYSDSPGVYGAGEFQITKSNVYAIGSESVVIEGSNSVTRVDTALKLDGSALSDPKGILIRQSGSGDAGTGLTSKFSMTGGSLAYTHARGPSLLHHEFSPNQLIVAVRSGALFRCVDVELTFTP